MSLISPCTGTWPEPIVPDIRTYSVVSLNEECGLIQWVPNTIPLRSILNAHYARRGKQLWVRISQYEIPIRAYESVAVGRAPSRVRQGQGRSEHQRNG